MWFLSGTAVFFLSFLLTAATLLLVATSRSRAAGLVAALGTLVVLAGLFIFVPGHRGSLMVGLLIPLVFGAAVLGWLRARTLPATLLLLGTLTLTLPAALASEGGSDRRSSIPDLDATEVTLSWKDFKSLVESTYVPPPVVPAPPTEAFLRSAEYRGRLAPGVLTLEGSLALEVLKGGWVRVPLATQGTVIEFVGEGAMLHRNGSGLEVLARGPGAYRLQVKLAFAAGDHPGENRLNLQLPDCPRNLVDLSVAPELQDVEVESGLAYASRSERLFVSLVGGALSVKYTLPFRQVEDAAGEEVELTPRVQVAAYQLLSLGEGVINGVLIHDYDVRVAKVSHFDIDLPEDFVIFDCTAAGLESWKILQHDDRRYLRVKLLAPTDGRVRVAVFFEGTYDPDRGRLAAPRFVPRDVERESGFVAVAADGAEIDLQVVGKLLPADVSEIPTDVRAYGGNLIAACKYSGAPDPVAVAVTEHEDAPVLTAIIERLNATAAMLENGTEATWIDLTVKNNRKQFLELGLPEGEVEVWSLLLDGQPTKPKRTGDQVLVPLPRGNGEVASTISLVLLRQGPELRTFGKLRPYLPSFDVPVSEALWTVYLPEGKRYRIGDGDFRPVVVSDPLLPRRASGVLAPSTTIGSTRAELELSYGDAVSEDAAASQLAQEESVRQQLARKGSSRRGTLPVRIAIPGGVTRLPRITVSRVLIVGDEPNSFPILVYPAWLANVLRTLQPTLILVAGMLLGLTLAGVLRRRTLSWAVLAAAGGLLPFGGWNLVFALSVLVVVTLAVLLSVPILRRFSTAGTS
jgi:hypothetical protein